MPVNETDTRFIKLKEAFRSDGFMVTKTAYTESGRLGLEARHTTAKNYDSGQHKKSYYIEGTPYERGYLLGLLAEPEIADMAVNFAGNVVFDFIGAEFLYGSPVLQDIMVPLVYEFSRGAWETQPAHVLEELGALQTAAKKATPRRL